MFSDWKTRQSWKIINNKFLACFRVDNAKLKTGWYLGKDSDKRVRATVNDKCTRKAVELRGGDSKTLLARGFAMPAPALGKELLPGRMNLPRAWVDTVCCSVRSKASGEAKAMQLRKAGSDGGGRSVLWCLKDLEAALGPR